MKFVSVNALQIAEKFKLLTELLVTFLRKDHTPTPSQLPLLKKSNLARKNLSTNIPPMYHYKMYFERSD